MGVSEDEQIRQLEAAIRLQNEENQRKQWEADLLEAARRGEGN